MKALKVIGVLMGILILIGIILYLSGPDKYYLERSIVINESPAAIYNELNSYKNFNKWSPWFTKDPNTKYNYDGPETGIGTKMSWVSEHKEVGSGSMWIVENEENKMVNSRMAFGDYPGEPNARLIIEDVGDGTSKVTWTYEEELHGIAPVFGIFFDLETMLGPDYEQGLSSLKTYIESKPTETEDIMVSVVDVKPVTYIGLEASLAPSNMEAISSTMGTLYEQLMQEAETSSLKMSGAPLAVYKSFDENNMVIICGLPVPKGTIIEHESITIGETPGGKAVKATHKGNYDKLHLAHEKVSKYIKNKDLKIAGYPYEVYITDPEKVSDTAQWITEVYYPLEEK
ncbi:GyrI-like domain-containing protein [Fulvivirga sp. 29W222]|uniref:GyrI-like domain-containing protein n=1 Tax=Fulvivirga marina TaxID=2494733 RepID=A0A937FZR5_9BACT|nr:GyrI-like domain-containing protein [Fulvivirga marina]MBL6447852.1 GyrI-like domain-containing protein [Fulvivirga marina]